MIATGPFRPGCRNQFIKARIRLGEDRITIDNDALVDDKLNRGFRIDGSRDKAQDVEFGAGFRPVEYEDVAIYPDLGVIESENDNVSRLDRSPIGRIVLDLACPRLLKRPTRVNGAKLEILNV